MCIPKAARAACLILLTGLILLCGQASCHSSRAIWENGTMSGMYFLAVQRDACQATQTLFRQGVDSALPVFVNAFERLQSREREFGEETGEVRIDMLAQIERSFRGNVDVMRVFDTLVKNDPSIEVRDLSRARAGAAAKREEETGGSGL